MKRIGIFSGTFDPVHEGHLAFARQALKAQGLDKIFFMVESRPRRKQGVKAFEHRQRMVALAVAGEPAFGSIILEQDRFTAHDTLPLLQARFKDAELYLLLGDDMLHHLGDWPHVEELVQGVGFVIGLRSMDRPDAEASLKALEQSRGLRLHCRMFTAPHSEYSSSRIRQAYKRDQPPEGLDPKVRRYIEKTGLYAPAD